MITGRYVLRLYCDSVMHTKSNPLDLDHEYMGPTERSCKKDATLDGWFFTKDGKVFCKGCKKWELDK